MSTRNILTDMILLHDVGDGHAIYVKPGGISSIERIKKTDEFPARTVVSAFLDRHDSLRSWSVVETAEEIDALRKKVKP
jgi:hypothetical protein